MGRHPRTVRAGRAPEGRNEMLDTIFGLPVHPLVIHATVAAVPAAAFAVAFSALWPRFRAWAGPLPLALAGVSLVLDPITASSGEALERRIGHNRLIERHSQLADGLLPWLIVLGAAAVAVTWVWWRERSAGVSARPRLAVMSVIGVVAVIAALGTVQQVVRIGHSGAKAAWSDVVSSRKAPGS